VAILGNTSSRVVQSLLEEQGWIEGEQFVNLDRGGYREFKYRGDFLVWCVPNNVLVSVKSFYAAERLLASATGTDLIGFGFFVRDGEFNVERTRTYRRAGFLAIYMPPNTLEAVRALHGGSIPENVNGTPFYRANSEFGADMLRVYETGVTRL
jgi:hypothetical protein